MSAAEIVFFPLKPSSDASTILRASSTTWKKHPNFRAAYHGPLVEDPKIHCLILEWKAKEDLLAWTRNYDAEEVEKGKVALIDGEAGLEPFATFINFKHDPTDALLAPITEFGFFSLPDKLATEQVVFDKLIGPGENMNDHPVITVGKAKGAATGHVFAVKPEMAAESQTTAFTGVFGYDSVEDHWKWRDTPEHAEVIKGMGKLVDEFGLKAVDVLGKRRAMFEGSGIVHVEFERIAQGATS